MAESWISLCWKRVFGDSASMWLWLLCRILLHGLERTAPPLGGPVKTQTLQGLPGVFDSADLEGA